MHIIHRVREIRGNVERQKEHGKTIGGDFAKVFSVRGKIDACHTCPMQKILPWLLGALLIGLTLFPLAPEHITGGLILAVALVMFASKGKEKTSPDTYSALGLVFVLLSVVSYFFSSTKTIGAAELFRDAGCVLLFLFFATSKHEDTKKWSSAIAWSLVVSGVLVCLVGIPLFFSNTFARFVGTFFDLSNTSSLFPNACAAFLLLAWPAALYILRSRPTIRVIVLSVLFGALLLTQSRAAIAAAILQLIILGWMNRKHLKPTSILLPCLGALIFAGILFFGRSVILPVTSPIDRLSFNDTAGAAPFSDRLELWREGWNVSIQKPLTGYGPESFQFASQYQARVPLLAADDAHNIILQFAAERGWPAAIIFVVLCAMLITSSLKKKPNTIEFFFAVSIFGLLAHAMLDRDTQFAALVLPLWVLLGVLGASEKKQKVKQKIPLFCFTILALGFLSAFFVVQDSGDKALFTGSEYIGSGKTAEAMAILTEYTQKNPEDPRGWYMLGEALHAGGKSSMALSAYEEAFTRGKWIYPEVTGGLLRKALVLHDTKLLTENEGVIDRVLKGFAEAVKNNDHYAAESDVPEILEWIFNEAIKAFPERKMEYTNLKEEVEKDAEMWRK